jgi:methylmalonyl-CoA mutase, C-terminal domain
MKRPTDTGGPPIRVLIAKPGLDGHDVGAKLVCRALIDAGMEVIYSGLKRSPEQIARTARDENVDVVGLSILSGAHLPLCRKVLSRLDEEEVSDVLLVVGGNIPTADRGTLEEIGVAHVFPVGSSFDEIVEFIRENVER